MCALGRITVIEYILPAVVAEVFPSQCIQHTAVTDSGWQLLSAHLGAPENNK